MSGDDLTLRAKERVKFDESAFFRHLRENPKNSALLALLRSIDRRACLEMATYIIRYLERWEEKQIMGERKRRGVEIKRALSVAITSLRLAAAQYRGVAAIRLPGGSLVTAVAPFWPEGFPFLADVLESEANTICVEHLTESQTKAFCIADNRLTENSAWDDHLLAVQLKSLSEVELDFSLEVTGFEASEIELMIEGIASVADGERDPADVMPEIEKAVQVSTYRRSLAAWAPPTLLRECAQGRQLCGSDGRPASGDGLRRSTK